MDFYRVIPTVTRDLVFFSGFNPKHRTIYSPPTTRKGMLRTYCNQDMNGLQRLDLYQQVVIDACTICPIVNTDQTIGNTYMYDTRTGRNGCL
jgi:hypothetical protein